MKNVGLTGLDGRGKALTLWAATTVLGSRRVQNG